MSEPRPVFRDPATQACFERDGFVKLRLLDQGEVETLRRACDQLHSFDPRAHVVESYARGYFASVFVNDAAYRSAVKHAILAVLGRVLDPLFAAYKVLYGGFLIKFPASDGDVPIHQDFSMVDEARFTPVVVWCPLQPTDATNGALSMLRGSHRFHREWRPRTLRCVYERHASLLRPLLEPQHVAAGEAVVFAPATVHCSAPNRSLSPRVVASAFACPREARVVVAHRPSEAPSRLELFAQDDDFLDRYLQFSGGAESRPAIGRLIGEVPYSDPSVSEEEMLALLAGRQR